MSLKIPILLSSIWLFNISFIPPNTPPDRFERVDGPFYERIFPITFPILHRLSASIPCLAESAVLLAVTCPSALSTSMLSKLVLTPHLPITHINRTFLVGSILAAIGSLGRLWCFRVLGRHFTHHLAVRQNHALITTGPYAFVRHPGYMFGQVSALGMSLVIASPGSFVRQCGWLDTTLGRVVVGSWAMQNVLTWALGYARCLREDAFLRAHFGAEWNRYSQRVRYRMIPGVF